MDAIKKGHLKISAMIFTCTLAASCDKEKGESIGAPQVEPPVTRNMPSGMKTASLTVLGSSGAGDGFVSVTNDDGTATASAMVSKIKTYLYPAGDGPSPINRLKTIDARMGSLNSRAEDSPRACLEEAARAYDLPTAMPTAETFPMSFQCLEVLSAESTMAFGKEGDYFYLAEQTGSTEDELINVFAKVHMDGSTTEVWDIGYQKTITDNSGETGPRFSAMHAIGNDTNGVEVTTAGTTTSYDLACGIHLKSNTSYIYVSGQLAYGGACTVSSTYCFEAGSLASADLSQCTAAGLDSFSLTTITQAFMDETVSTVPVALNTHVTGYTSFNTDK